MFWSFRNPLRIPGLVTNTVRRWSVDHDYSLLPNHNDSRRESEWSVVSAGDREKEREKDVDEVGPVAGAVTRRTRTLVVLSLCALLLGVMWWTCRIPALDIEASPISQDTPEVVREVIHDDRDQTHIYLAPLTPLPASRRLLAPSFKTAVQLDLVEYMSTGLFPPLDDEFGPAETVSAPIDIVYLWVNSTDAFFPESFVNRMSEEGLPVDRGQARRWRDNGELKGAVRSSVQSLGNGLRKVHIVSGDYPLNEFKEEEEVVEMVQANDASDRPGVRKRGILDSNDTETETEEGWTVGQIPEWLDWSATQSKIADMITWHFHSDIYRLPRDHHDELLVGREAMAGMVLVQEDGEEVSRNVSLEEEWRELALPTFNSFAIESRVGWITGLSENFVMSNDDMFFLTPLSTADFHHPLLGPILRVAPGLPVRPFLTADLLTTHGEWGGLQHASTLLSRRFANRAQPYPEHFPKSLTLPMMDEASIMFAEDLSISTTRGFRESLRGKADIEMAALASWLRIERWREALLWTWIVGKIGGEEGVWGEESRLAIQELFGDALAQGINVKIRKGPRKTVEDAQAYMEEMGLEGPMKTKIKFSSLDGHLPKNPDSPGRQCFFSPFCLPDGFFTDPSATFSAEAVFKRMAFDRAHCGDCLIDALMTASGERGLSAFLPDGGVTIHPDGSQNSSRWRDTGPILPLTKEWSTTNFSLSAVITPDSKSDQEKEVNLREWCLSLLARYTYAIGGTPAFFAPVGSTRQLSYKLAEVDQHSDIALVCVNDDIPDGNDVASERFKGLLGRWMDTRWPIPGPWERRRE